MASGRPWPGYQARFCPVCRQEVGTHREPVEDERNELVNYHEHWDTVDKTCPMSGKRAAIRAVAFTGTATRAPRAAIA